MSAPWTSAHEAALGRALTPATASPPMPPPRKVVAPREVRAEVILQVVARLSGTTVDALVGPARWRSIALPRHIAMWLLRSRTAMSFPEIGRVFSGRDHTTVISAVRKVDRLCEESEEVAGFVARCGAEIEMPSRIRIQLDEERVA